MQRCVISDQLVWALSFTLEPGSKSCSKFFWDHFFASLGHVYACFHCKYSCAGGQQIGLIMSERLREIVSCVKKPELKNWKSTGVKGRMEKVIWRTCREEDIFFELRNTFGTEVAHGKNVEADKSEERREMEEAMGKSNKFQQEYRKPASCSCDVKHHCMLSPDVTVWTRTLFCRAEVLSACTATLPSQLLWLLAVVLPHLQFKDLGTQSIQCLKSCLKSYTTGAKSICKRSRN